MSSSLFVPAILNQDARLHFALPKFQMYNGLQDLFNHLMHFLQVMTLQTSNDALLYKVFKSSLASLTLSSLTLSWFHHLTPNTVTSFRRLYKKFLTQYICLVRRKQSVINLFHVRMGEIRDHQGFYEMFWGGNPPT